MKKLIILFSLAVLLVSFTYTTNPSKRPNFIYVLADDLGYGDLSCYGQERFSTPSLDRMAAEGIRFTDFYAGSTVCAPSRYALMTGKHMGNAAIRGNGEYPLAATEQTIASHLQQNGYETALFGKWGLGLENNSGSPEKQGWNTFFGYLHHEHAHRQSTDFLWEIQDNKMVKVATDPNRHTHLYFMDKAMNFLENNTTKPFFLYLSLSMPHAELAAPSEADVLPYLDASGVSKFPEIPFAGRGNYRSQQQPKATFAGMVSRIDADMGKLMNKLYELGLQKNTYVFFTSDNGPHREGGATPDFFNSNGGLRGIKRDLYEGGIRVPFIAWGGPVAKGKLRNDPLANWDVFPTLAKLAKTDAPKHLDGLSFVNALRGKPLRRQHNHLYWEFYEGGFVQAVRQGNWKAIRYHRKANEMELYDLATDKAEKDNIAAQNPAIVERMKQIMEQNRQPHPIWDTKIN